MRDGAGAGRLVGVYSLVSASLLAIDLARHPSGTAVADVVDRVLCLRPQEVASLGSPADQDVRACVEQAARLPRVGTVLGAVSATLADGLPAADTSRVMVTTMAETLTGTLTDLHDLLRAEPPLRAAPPAAAQVALDAVTAAWAGRSASLEDLTHLRAPWLAALDPVPPGLQDADYRPDLTALLEEVPRRSPDQWARTADAHRDRTHPRWSALMNPACAAAAEADRLVEVARAQLAAARALRLSGVSTGEHAGAASMAVTAAVQGLCTRDLRDDTELQRAWRAGS